VSRFGVNDLNGPNRFNGPVVLSVDRMETSIDEACARCGVASSGIPCLTNGDNIDIGEYPPKYGARFRFSGRSDQFDEYFTRTVGSAVVDGKGLLWRGAF